MEGWTQRTPVHPSKVSGTSAPKNFRAGELVLPDYHPRTELVELVSVLSCLSFSIRPYRMTSPTRTSVRRTPYADLGAFPDLFVDYCTKFDTVSDFYGGDWRDPDARREAATRAADRPVDRDELADVLLEQNERWGLDDETRRQIEALRDPETVAVVTGQQAGLLTGPLYTIYKTITTLQLATALAENTGRTVVPVFWVEGEDHDFEEIATAHLFDRNEVADVEYQAPDRASRDVFGPVGRLSLSDDALERVLESLEELLPSSDFKSSVMECVRTAYRPGTTLEDAFARLVKLLFQGEGLVCINPDDSRLKALVRPLFRRELEDPTMSSECVASAGRELQRRGYHEQVTARPTNLFWLGDDERRAIDIGDDGIFSLRGTDRTRTRSELLDRLDRDPERFSPNVVLRPLMQDRILPTAGYVGGPGEVSYFAQYGGVYEWADMEMPLIHPRASVSLVEGKVQKVLDKYDLSVADFAADVDTLFQEVVVETMEVDVEEVFQHAMRYVHEAMNSVKPEAEAVDRSLVSSVEATRSSLRNEMERLKTKVVRAEKRQHDEIRAQLEKAHVNLRPDGSLQERAINILYYANKYSLNLLDDLQEELGVDTSSHQVVEL